MRTFDFYASIGLDRAKPPGQLAADIDWALSAPGLDAGQIDQLRTARAILGDPARRAIYDRHLDDPAAGPLGVEELRRLARTATAPPAAGSYGAPGSPTPEYPGNSHAATTHARGPQPSPLHRAQPGLANATRQIREILGSNPKAAYGALAAIGALLLITALVVTSPGSPPGRTAGDGPTTAQSGAGDGGGEELVIGAPKFHTLKIIDEIELGAQGVRVRSLSARGDGTILAHLAPEGGGDGEVVSISTETGAIEHVTDVPRTGTGGGVAEELAYGIATTLGGKDAEPGFYVLGGVDSFGAYDAGNDHLQMHRMAGQNRTRREIEDPAADPALGRMIGLCPVNDGRSGSARIGEGHEGFNFPGSMGTGMVRISDGDSSVRGGLTHVQVSNSVDPVMALEEDPRMMRVITDHHTGSRTLGDDDGFRVGVDPGDTLARDGLQVGIGETALVPGIADIACYRKDVAKQWRAGGLDVDRGPGFVGVINRELAGDFTGWLTERDAGERAKVVDFPDRVDLVVGNQDWATDFLTIEGLRDDAQVGAVAIDKLHGGIWVSLRGETGLYLLDLESSEPHWRDYRLNKSTGGAG